MIAILLAAAMTIQPVLTVQVKPLVPFSITWDQPIQDLMPSFRLWCDGGIVKNYLNSEVLRGPLNPDNTITLSAVSPGLVSGTHNCQVSAFFSSLEEAKSDSITIVSTLSPATPLRLRILVEVKSGG